MQWLVRMIARTLSQERSWRKCENTQTKTDCHARIKETTSTCSIAYFLWSLALWAIGWLWL